MLVINRELPIPNEDTLEVFKSAIVMETYDEESKKYAKIYMDHIDRIYQLDMELMDEVARKISPHVIPVVSVNTKEDYQFMELDFAAITDDENLELKQKDHKLFRDLCYKKFKNEQSLLEKIASQ